MEIQSLIAVLIVLILFLIYSKQKEQFSNRTKQHFNYNNLLSKSSPQWVQTNKTLDEIQYVLLEIITLINKETKKEFYIGNIDNVSKNKIENDNTHYIVDVFLFEKTEHFTLRVIIDFTIDKKNNVTINTITKSNANKYYYDTESSQPYNFESCITDKSNQTEKIYIKGFNEISLPHALYEGELSRKVPTIPEFNKDILPVMLQKDVHYSEFKKNNKNRGLSNATSIGKHKKYDRFSLLIEDDDDKNENTSEKQSKLLKLQPQFNPSIHKNQSDKKENNWLFKPTRTDITNVY